MWHFLLILSLLRSLAKIMWQQKKRLNMLLYNKIYCEYNIIMGNQIIKRDAWNDGKICNLLCQLKERMSLKAIIALLEIFEFFFFGNNGKGCSVVSKNYLTRFSDFFIIKNKRSWLRKCLKNKFVIEYFLVWNAFFTIVFYL